MQVAYSEDVKGVACVEGGIFGAQSGSPSLSDALDTARKHERNGDIAPLKNLADSPVFITSGSSDWIVPRSEHKKVESFYKEFGAKTYMYENDYTHIWPVDKPDSMRWPYKPCKSMAMIPFMWNQGMQNCHDDLAGRILRYLYESLDPDFKLQERTDKWKDLGVL